MGWEGRRWERRKGKGRKLYRPNENLGYGPVPHQEVSTKHCCKSACCPYARLSFLSWVPQCRWHNVTGRLCRTIKCVYYGKVEYVYKQELSCRKKIARQLRIQYVEGIHRPKYYNVTLKSHGHKGDASSQWEKANLPLSPHPHPLTDSNEILHTWLRPPYLPKSRIWSRSPQGLLLPI